MPLPAKLVEEEVQDELAVPPAEIHAAYQQEKREAPVEDAEQEDCDSDEPSPLVNDSESDEGEDFEPEHNPASKNRSDEAFPQEREMCLL